MSENNFISKKHEEVHDFLISKFLPNYGISLYPILYNLDFKVTNIFKIFKKELVEVRIFDKLISEFKYYYFNLKTGEMVKTNLGQKLKINSFNKSFLRYSGDKELFLDDIISFNREIFYEILKQEYNVVFTCLKKYGFINLGKITFKKGFWDDRDSIKIEILDELNIDNKINIKVYNYRYLSLGGEKSKNFLWCNRTAHSFFNKEKETENLENFIKKNYLKEPTDMSLLKDEVLVKTDSDIINQINHKMILIKNNELQSINKIKNIATIYSVIDENKNRIDTNKQYIKELEIMIESHIKDKKDALNDILLNNLSKLHSLVLVQEKEILSQGELFLIKSQEEIGESLINENPNSKRILG